MCQPLFIARQHTDARYWYSKSVCPSVRYVPLPDENGLTYRHSFFTILAQSFHFYQHQTYSRNSDGVTSRGSAKYRWGITILRCSTNNSLYLANDTKYRHSCYDRRIWTRMRSIKWCHFQLPWTTPNLVFKVTAFFDTEYLTNGYRYGRSYYRRRIGNRTKAFEWHQFQWHWVTSIPDFKVVILFNVKKLENGTR